MKKHLYRNGDMKDLGILKIVPTKTRQLIYKLDPETYQHCCRLSLLAKAFSKFLQLSNQETQLLMWGAYFHDIGKVFISPNILHKPTALDLEEWGIMKLHPMIDNTDLHLPEELETIIPIIQCHHERWDGSGYPYGLCKEEIPHLARIVQILDIYEALTHKRSYKPAFSPLVAIAIIQEEARKGWYQPLLIEQIVEFVYSSHTDHR
ncbi:HD-GYP domain-containing protein [Pseudanabaena yagii]|uniref:HD domain-containing protein n=1 Tax=Pseudanabaena yagii GIHE-NHR1 TaxID=2722753 RepID=A0ABX1LVH1_9CYAN|nr:HD domain-containing phosphohydrolase [Pseudanabaena yagii]NMF59010.1 HD domain-containing protein [Pseudanabaena yagii GIHE-NHR1]